MKNYLLSILMVCMALCAGAQPQLLGSTGSDGTHAAGTIIHYIGGDTVVSGEFDYPANGNNTGPLSIGLTEEPNHKILGLVSYGGASGLGTLSENVFAGNAYTVRVSFDTATGFFPTGSLLHASNGLYYGLTNSGDSANGGSLFSYAQDSTSVTALVALPASANPVGSLIQARNGKLYGLTQNNGADSGGTIFQYDITGAAYTTMLSLPHRAYPTGSLLEVGADTLYGLTNSDGTNGGGTLFRYIAGSGTDLVLYNFATLANPYGTLIRATDGKLYGMTNGDGVNHNGTIFSYDIATGVYTDLHDFGRTGDGSYPEGDLLQASDGMLYGMTFSGGNYSGGIIFQYNISDSTYTKKADLTTATGDYPGFGAFMEYFTGAPSVATSPRDTTVCPEATASFTATSSATADIQWQVSTDGGSTYSFVYGTADSTLSFIVSPADSGHLYRAVFTNALGADTSTAARLTTFPISPLATVSYDTCTAAQSGALYQWVFCSTLFAVAGGSSQTLVASENGSYLCIISSGNCSDTTNCVTVNIPGLGIRDVSAYHFNLYPDPTSGMFAVSSDYNGPLSVQVMSLVGERLREFSMTSSQNQFDISDLAAGIYQVQISDGTHTLRVLKVVKE